VNAYEVKASIAVISLNGSSDSVNGESATFNSYGNRQISTPYKINTPEPIDKKFGTVYYVREGTPIPDLVQIHPLRASGQMDEI